MPNRTKIGWTDYTSNPSGNLVRTGKDKGMTTKTRYPLDEALTVATDLQYLVSPACQRIGIAGSVRRLSPTVGDIELVCIPRSLYYDGTLAWDPLAHSHPAQTRLDLVCNCLVAEGVLALRLNTKGHATYGPLNKLLLHQPSGIPVDIFTATKENWGMAFMVRTGSKDWNIKVMSEFRRRGMRGHAYGGITDAVGREIDCPEEIDVFRYLGWPWREPSERQ